MSSATSAIEINWNDCSNISDRMYYDQFGGEIVSDLLWDSQSQQVVRARIWGLVNLEFHELVSLIFIVFVLNEWCEVSIGEDPHTDSSLIAREIDAVLKVRLNPDLAQQRYI